MASFRNAGAALGAYTVVGGRPELSADLLRQLDDDPFRAADVAEPIAVFVLLHRANERRAAGSQAGDDGVDVVDCECEMAEARGVRRRMPVAARATMRSTQPPSTDHSPWSLSPSSTKNAVAAARSSTTMPACSIRWIVMRSTLAERRPQLQRLSVADRLLRERAEDDGATCGPERRCEAARAHDRSERCRALHGGVWRSR